MRTALAWQLAFVCLSACGSRTPLAEPAGDGGASTAGDDGGDGDGASRGSSSARTSAAATSGSSSASATPGSGGADGSGGAEPTPDPQCLCPDEPGYVECVLPFMCCPCEGTCENPDTFNCSCGDPRQCIDPEEASREP